MATPNLHVLLQPTLAKAAEEPVASSFITDFNDTHSPLLRLPGEIRNLIYGFIFTSAPYILIVEFNRDGDAVGVRAKDRPAGIDLARVCRKLYQDTTLLPFVLGEFHCLNTRTLGRLHEFLQPEQRKAMRKLVVEVKVDDYWLIGNFLWDTRRRGVLLSDRYPNIEQVMVVARSDDFSSIDPLNRSGVIAANLRITQANRKRLEDWLRYGTKQGFKVVFEEVVTKHEAWV